MDAMATGEGAAILEIGVSVTTGAQPGAVFDALADLNSHARWNGAATLKRSGLLSVDAPDGQAGVGTEWRSTGKDLDGSFADRSVVTEAERPRVFEFVTEARQTGKRGATRDWTNVCRYEIEPTDSGSRIIYRVRTLRLSTVPKVFKVPVLRSIAAGMARSMTGKSVKSLAAYAERVAGA